MAEIVFIDGGYEHYDRERHACAAAGYSFEVFAGGRHDRDAKIAFARDARGILVRWTDINDDFLRRLPDLKALVRCGVGYDNVDVDAARRRGVRVANVSGYATHSVSDHALALILACSRALPRGQATFQTRYGAPPIAETLDLYDKTLGIIGLGRIGGMLARKAQPLFGRVLALDPYITPAAFAEAGAVSVDLPTLLRESHVISLNCNLTHETRGLLGARAFTAMEQRPILVNAARGPVLDWRALQAALGADRVHSAGLDVFDDEPPGPDMAGLLADPRVIATGHYAWYSPDAVAQLQQKSIANLLGLLRGEAVADELTCERGGLAR